MKDTKLSAKQFLVLAALVVLILLLIICVTMCGKQAEDVPAPEATTEPVVAAAQQVTEPVKAPTEESTFPTEETTEPTEETEAATLPGIIVDNSISSGSEKEEEYVEIPDPGSPENPYVEVVSTYPGTVDSVYISAGTDVSYLIAGSAGSVITIEDPTVTLTVDGKTYAADETTGIVMVDLSKLGMDPVVQLKNLSAATANCVVKLEEGLGGAGNPEILTDPVEIQVSLPEGDVNGYHYQWIATTDGKVELTLKEEAAPEEEGTEVAEQNETEDTEESDEESSGETEETEPVEEIPVLEIVVTIGEETFRLSEFEDGILSFDVEKDEPVLIQVITVPRKDGTYPAIEETVLWNLLPALGTVENPQVLESIEEIAVTLEENDDDGWHFLWLADTDGQLTLTPDAALAVTATVEETVYQSAEDENAVSFHVTRGHEVLIQVTAIPTIPEGEEEETWPAVTGKITGQLMPDPGAPENPLVLESIETISVALAEGDADGYTCAWTAPMEGTLTLWAETNGAKLEVLLTAADGAVIRLSEATDGILTLETQAGDIVTILVTAVADEARSYAAGQITLKGSFEASPGSTAENPIILSDLGSATTVAMEARQTLYFSGMVHEMVATVENANGVSIHYDGKTSWGSQTGTARMEFPEADAEAPEEALVFSVTSKNEKELTLVFAYPAGHPQNPAPLVMGENKIQLKENDTDGYLFTWTADCDGILTVAMEEKAQWQYQIRNLTAGTEGIFHTSAQEPLVAEEAVEVKAGDRLQILVKTLDPADPEAAPAGTLTVKASFFDPLLGTEAKPIRLDSGKNIVNTVTVPAGQTLYFSAKAENMILSFAGRNVALSHNGVEHIPDNGKLELLCQDADTVLTITNATDRDEVCKLSFAYPKGHRKNPMELILGENTAVLEDGNINGCAFVWTAEATGQLTITISEDAGWQYVLCNETTGTDGVVHTSQDEPKVASELLEVTAGDRILLIVNSFDLEHPLHTPAGEVKFTAEFVDPTLGMEENPVWLNHTDEILIPAGKTMYCTAKADGMLLTLEGTGVKVCHNDVEYLPEQNVLTILCQGAGTFEHPVFVITNTGTTDGVYSIRFTYPEGHFMNPADLNLGQNIAEPEMDSKYGYHFLWTSNLDGTLTVNMETESGWSYSVANLTNADVGEEHLSTAEEPVWSETIEVCKGDRIRIVVNAHSSEEGTSESGSKITFTVTTAAAEEVEEETEPQPNTEEPA